MDGSCSILSKGTQKSIRTEAGIKPKSVQTFAYPLIVESNLRDKWGLKIGIPGDTRLWSEFEIHNKRPTIMIPRDLVPELDDLEGRF